MNTFRPSFGISVCFLLITLALAGCGTLAQPQVRASIGAVEAVNASGAERFARVTEPRPFVFPQDHGPHPEYQTEWWYYTGNLQGQDGRHFGFQLTFFRRGLTADPVQRGSEWGTHNIYMAHFALSDVASGEFYAYDRFSRDAAGLAGATGEPFRVFLEDWTAEGYGPEGMQMHLQAAEGEIAIDLMLESVKPPVLQGDQGLSQKGAEVGNASYYYSLTRMATTGSVRIADAAYDVSGWSWMDHEFGTSALEGNAAGWDWFSIQLDNLHEITFWQIRDSETGAPIYTSAAFIEPDGHTHVFDGTTVQVDVLDTWRSPRSGADYPSGWQLTFPEQDITLRITPYLADQELPTSIVYWEGTVQIEGTQQGHPVQGNGYVELTGYAEAAQGEFTR